MMTLPFDRTHHFSLDLLAIDPVTGVRRGLSPREGLALAEELARVSFRRAMLEEAGVDDSGAMEDEAEAADQLAHSTEAHDQASAALAP